MIAYFFTQKAGIRINNDFLAANSLCHGLGGKIFVN